MPYSLKKLYLQSAAIAGGAKIFLALSGVAMVWFLNLIFGKDDFGAFMIVFALYQIVAITVAAAFQSLILFHTPDHGSDSNSAEISALEQSCFTHASALSLICAAGFMLGAPMLAGAFNKPELAPIFASLAFMIPAFTMNLTLTSWYRAHQDIAKLTLYNEIIPSAVRISAMAALAFTPALHDRTIQLASAVFIGAYLIPFAALYAQKPFTLSFSFAPYSAFDVRHGVSSALGQLLMRSSRNLVIVIAGAMTSNTVTADFAVAARFSQLLLIPKNAISQLLVPRLRAHIKQGARDHLHDEFTAMQAVKLTATMFGTCVFLMGAPDVLALFGDYGQGAFVMLIALALSSVIIAGFGDIGSYVSIAGHAHLGLLAHLASLCVLILGLVILTPLHGGLGMAYAVVIASAFTCTAMVGIVSLKEKHTPIHWPELTAMALFTVSIIAFVHYSAAPAFSIAAICAAVTAAYIFIRIKTVLRPFAHTKA